MKRRSCGQIRTWLLREIKAENITWQSDAIGRVSYRVWMDERNYRTLTTSERDHLESYVIGLGYAKRFNGVGVWNRGGIELTPTGEKWLGALQGTRK